MPTKYSTLIDNATRLMKKDAAWFLPALSSLARMHGMGTVLWSLGDPDRSFFEALPHYALSPKYLAMNTLAGYGSNLAYRGVSGLGKGISKIPGFRTIGTMMRSASMPQRVRRAAVLQKAREMAGIKGKAGIFDTLRTDEGLFKKYPLLTKRHISDAEKLFETEYQKQLRAMPGSSIGHLPILRTMSGRSEGAINDVAKRFGINTMVPSLSGAAFNVFGPLSIPTMAYATLTGKQNPLDIMSKLYNEDLYSGTFGGASKYPAYF